MRGQYNAAVKPLLDGIGSVQTITQSDVNWKSNDFNPKDKDAFIDVEMIGLERLSLGQGATSSDEYLSALQLSVYVKRETNAAITLQNIIDDIMPLYRCNMESTHNDHMITFTNINLSAPRTDGGWYVRDITIDFFYYEDR